MLNANLKILIAEDVALTRKVVRGTVESMGFENVVEVADGEDAWLKLRTASSQGEPFGLVICDIDMPHLNGIELLKKIRADKELSKIPFVLVTGHAEKDVVLMAAQSGSNAFLTKPFEPDDLVEKVRRLLDKA